MEISPKLNLKILQKINSEGVNSALYIVKDEQLNCEMILKQIDKKKLKEYDKYFEESKKISSLRSSQYNNNKLCNLWWWLYLYNYALL